MKLREVGEFGLIELIARWVGPPPPGVVIGIGDDAAVCQGGTLQLATTDSLVEGVHFLPDKVTWEELGWKALAVGLSDIAAMGGIPRYALVSLSLPPEREVEEVKAFYTGLLNLARECQVAVVGGDLHSSPHVAITITLFGSLDGETPLTRSAARSGELIAVTGDLGSSAGGLAMMKRGLKLEGEVGTCLRQAHLRPRPRLQEGRQLVALGVRAAIDISDGLVHDLRHLCRMSGVGARVWVERLPIHPHLRRAFGEEALAFALSGGEDYELLFTAPPPIMRQAAAELPATPIGEILPQPGKIELLDEQGNPFPWEEGGWEHFVPRGLQPES